MSDYEEFVERMGSFDMELSLDDIGPNKDELAHYGILGMKWGVRRYQNKDGSLTAAGKKRYNRDEQKIVKKKPSVKEMSDDELRKAVNRLQLERQYSQLSPSNIVKGKEYTKKVIKAGTTVAAVTSAAVTIHKNIGKIKEIIEKKG